MDKQTDTLLCRTGDKNRQTGRRDDDDGIVVFFSLKILPALSFLDHINSGKMQSMKKMKVGASRWAAPSML